MSKLGKDEMQVRIRVELQLLEQPAEASVLSTTPRSAGWYPFPGASLLAPQSLLGSCSFYVSISLLQEKEPESAVLGQGRTESDREGTQSKD